MITSNRFGLRSVHVYCDEQPGPGPFDLIHYHQIAQPVPGSRFVPFWTPLIDLTQEPDRIFSQFKRETRRVIRRAEESAEFYYEFHTRPDGEMIRYFAELQRRFARLKGIEQNQDDLRQVAAGGLLNISFVRSKDNVPVVWRAYYQCGKRTRAFRWGTPRLETSNPTERQYIGKASRYGLWRDMLSAREQKFAVFDLAGWYTGAENRELLAINHFKKEFGGRIVQEFNCTLPASWKGRLAIVVRELPSAWSAQAAPGAE